MAYRVSTASMSGDRLAGDIARLGCRARDRVASALDQLFLAEDRRLSDQQRGLMTELLASMVDTIEDDLRGRLVPLIDGRLGAAAEAAIATLRVRIARPILEEGGALHDPELIALLLRRVDEHRLTLALRRAAAASGEPSSGLIDRLIADRGESLPGLAMAYTIAESRGFDRFGEPILAHEDLPPELRHRLVWRAAAAVRSYLAEQHGLSRGEADGPLAAAAGQALAAQDEATTLDATTHQLVAALDALDRLDDRLLGEALGDARPGIFVGGVARRARLPVAILWEMIADREAGQLGLALRAIGMARGDAGAILDRLDAIGEESRLGSALSVYDALDAAEADAALQPLRLDPAFGAAIVDVAMARPR